MENQTISALVGERAKAEKIILALVEAGINPSQISMLSAQKEEEPNMSHEKTTPSPRNWRTEERIPSYPSRDKNFPKRIYAFENQTKASEGATAGATTGGILGGAVGLLAGIGALAIPGIGPLIAAGPLMAALSGIGAGGTLGSIIGGLIGSGIPEKEAIHYEGGIKEGKILLSVQTDSESQAQKTIDIFSQQGARDVSSSLKLHK